MAIAPPRPKGPPLNALRAFEAAARHESFALAAAELCVTAGAVAQQVKLLEAWIGRKLFEREAQGVRLSPNGRAALSRLTVAFDELGVAVHELRRLSVPTDLRIATLPSVAQLWLLSRLPALRSAFREIAISITAMENPPNLIRKPYDLALFFEKGNSSKTSATVLSSAHRFPVCSPKIARRLKQPLDLAGETLSHDATWRDDWQRWLRLAGVTSCTGENGPVFSLYSLAVAEARNGAGVLIANAPLVEPLLCSGELVQPFKLKDEDTTPLVATMRSAESKCYPARVIAWLADRRRNRLPRS
jgi:LysR family glycine cleavage system transcriptional activator